MKFHRGFTLIEILVVVSIFGLLSSIVLATLQTSKTKAVFASGQLFEAHSQSALGADIKAGYEFKKNTSNPAIVLNTSGNNDNAYMIGTDQTLWPEWVPDFNNVSDSALYFDGIVGEEDYLVAYNMDFLEDDPSATDLTLMMWVYAEDFNQNAGLLSKGNWHNNWALKLVGGNVVWINEHFSSQNNLSCPAPANDLWHHILVTQSGTNGALYIDGFLCAVENNLALVESDFDQPNQGSAGSLEGNLYFGAVSDDYPGAVPLEYFNGAMDEVMIYLDSLPVF